MKTVNKYLSIVMLCFASATAMSQSIKEYNLYVQDTLVNFTGKDRKAISINGQIPAPTLYFTEGDTAIVNIHNNMHHETSIHWHGLLLPNEQDGVPYLTTAPIEPMSTHQFKFVIRQSGTYWYHSHTMLQEQVGMYGAIVIHKPNEPVINEEVVLLSDWSDENPHEIERSLHYANDWYAIKKNAVQSYGEALKSGNFKTKLTNEWKRMNAMDVSDVYYERFLVNGATQQQSKKYKAGDKVRLRIINGSASTYFWVTYSGGEMWVVASDGMNVDPVEVDRFIVGTSETYDVIVTIPADGTAYELLATSEDRTGSASLWLGDGMKQKAKPLPRLKYFEGMKMMNDMMTMGGNMKDMGMDMSLQQMDMNTVMYPEITGGEKSDIRDYNQHAQEQEDIVTLNYAMLKSPVKTTLPDVPFRTLNFELTGNMNRYVWTINNKTVSESDKILIKKGENVRIIIKNNSMMRHPMHLHGHFFRVVNEHGEYSPLKNVLDIMPMETDTIEFNAAEEYGDWYFHCHILYHMMAGMGRIFSYEDSPPNPQIANPKAALKKVYGEDRRLYLGGLVGLESNGSDGNMSLMNTRWVASAEWRLGLNKRHGYEADARIGRFLDHKQFLMAYVGWNWFSREEGRQDKSLFGQIGNQKNWGAFTLGLQYTLPLLLVAQLQVDHTGYVRAQLRRDDIPVTRRLRLWGMINTNIEYAFGARYILNKYLSASTHYDSDMKFGAGITLMY